MTGISDVSEGSLTVVYSPTHGKDVRVTTDPQRASRYALSFTSGGLLTREALTTAPLYLRERDWDKVRKELREENLLQARTASSGARLSREVVQRLAVLDDDEIALLVDSTATERGHLMWAAACRRYELIGEFAEEVLRERYLLMTPTLGHEEFDSFLRGKALWHEELTALKGSTTTKLRATLFRMMREAGLLAGDGGIVPAEPSPRLADLLSARSPSDLRFFPTGGAL